MDQALNVDRYLTQRVGVVRRLLDAELPAPAAERWVAAWEAEAHLRGLDPGDAEWWRMAWEWIAQDCGGSERPAPSSHGAPASLGAATGGDAHALAEWLRHAMKRGAEVEEQLLIHVMERIRSSDVLAAFRTWLDARVRYRATDPDAPDREWLRREMKRLCAAYAAAVGEAH